MRCAIYTRKSQDERADSQFGSIEIQRELCAAYVASQAGEGWTLLPNRYDDEGYSGGNLRRPALADLLRAVDAGEVDVIVVYKIDRLSRSLKDFLDLVAHFERAGVTFVAITQSFSTTTSMGRLTLNVLLSFAQFEREVTGERLRDWFAGARARGLWTTGAPPYGYHVEQLRLIVNEVEAEVIRYAYQRYPKVGSSRLLADELNAKGFVGKRNRPFSRSFVTRILNNRLYRGDLTHRGKPVPGQHEAIVTERAWRAVQAEMTASGRGRGARARPQVPGLLKGLLTGPHGGSLIHVSVSRPRGIYRYYIAGVTRYQSIEGRFRAPDVETALVEALERAVGALPVDQAQRTGAVKRLVEHIELGPSSMVVRLTTGGRLTVKHTALIPRR